MIQENHIESAIKELFTNLRFTAEPAGYTILSDT